MSALQHKRAIGDTLSEFAVQLRLGDDPYNLTGFDVKFMMTDLYGNVVLAETDTGISISDYEDGLVEFDFPPEAVATAGTFRGFFKIHNGSDEPDTFPQDSAGIEIIVFNPEAVLPSDEPTGIDIIAAANAPARVRTVEGTVEERSLTELIKADQYQNSKNAADAPPWGIRIAKTKPPSIVGLILLCLGIWVVEKTWPGYAGVRYRWYECGRPTIWVMETITPPTKPLHHYQRERSLPPGADPHNL